VKNNNLAQQCFVQNDFRLLDIEFVKHEIKLKS